MGVFLKKIVFMYLGEDVCEVILFLRSFSTVICICKNVCEAGRLGSIWKKEKWRLLSDRFGRNGDEPGHSPKSHAGWRWEYGCI
jgi:hypothetical protein